MKLTASEAESPGSKPTAWPQKRVLIFPAYRTAAWWRYIGKHLGWGQSVVVTDVRGQGDLCVVDDFYCELNRLQMLAAPASVLLTDAETVDVIARCRLLRWLDPHLATAMVHAMAIAMDKVLQAVNPTVILSFPIDRYVMDVLERLAKARGIPYLELTASVVPRMSMLLYRGGLVRVSGEPPVAEVQTVVREIANPQFVPSYVQKRSKYTKAKFVRTLAYFRTRALAFKLISILKRDPLNLHYMDAQPFLGHKCKLSDIRVVDLCDQAWREKAERVPREKRVMFALQLFPEASIDYWLRNVTLIDHENIVVEAAQSFSEAGYTVLVKDHPSQFGFRQTAFLDRLLAIPRVILVPYEISGNELVSISGASFTCTGTLGLQAALAGLTSVVMESYYSNESDFIVVKNRNEIKNVGMLAEAARFNDSIDRRRSRLITNLLQGSFEGDFFSFQKFDARNPDPGALALSKALGRRMDQLLAEGRL